MEETYPDLPEEIWYFEIDNEEESRNVIESYINYPHEASMIEHDRAAYHAD